MRHSKSIVPSFFWNLDNSRIVILDHLNYSNVRLGYPIFTVHSLEVNNFISLFCAMSFFQIVNGMNLTHSHKFNIFLQIILISAAVFDVYI